MSLPATIEKQTAGENEPKQSRTRRAKLPGMARKAIQFFRRLEEAAIREEEQNITDHARVCALGNRATGGSFSSILKKSPALTDDDRAFLKELGYI